LTWPSVRSQTGRFIYQLRQRHAQILQFLDQKSKPRQAAAGAGLRAMSNDVLNVGYANNSIEDTS
jgi:hypothetical protein